MINNYKPEFTTPCMNIDFDQGLCDFPLVDEAIMDGMMFDCDMNFSAPPELEAE